MPFGQPLKATDGAFDVLAVAVAGSILQHFVPILGEKHDAKAAAVKPESVMTDETRQLLTAFQKPVRTQADPYPTSRGSCRGSGQRRRTCTTARCRPWKSC